MNKVLNVASCWKYTKKSQFVYRHITVQILIFNSVTWVIKINYFATFSQALPTVAMLWTVNAIKVL